MTNTLQRLKFGIAVAGLGSLLAFSAHAALFKIDFSDKENTRVPTDADGNPNGSAPAPLTTWDVIGTWTFADFPDGVAKWKLTDFSDPKNTNVSLTISDNDALSSAQGFAPPKGMTGNNPTKEGLDVEYNGIQVPHIVKDDYIYRDPCPAGSEMLFKFGGLKPGTYDVTLFMGRTTDNDGQFGKVWADDSTDAKEPAAQNTGDFGSKNLVTGQIYPGGQPQTVTVTLTSGQYLWFAYMEDSSGGISGLIIQDAVAKTTPPPSSKGLWKIDFSDKENTRPLVDGDDTTVPPPLADWDVIPTFTFDQFPNNVAQWNLTDWSSPKNTNVVLTISDNDALSSAQGFAPPKGMTGNNPTKEGLDVVYDSVLVPRTVKDDYLYRDPCPAGSEMLFKFGNIPAGTYNVTLLMGRTTDNDGQFGKVWVDDATGSKEPTAQNTGDFGSKDLVAGPDTPGGATIPQGHPQTVKVTLKTGDYLWFGYMEDSSGGISGMIIRGIVDGGTSGPGAITSTSFADGKLSFQWADGTATLQTSSDLKTWSDVTGAKSPYSTPTSAAAAFYRLKK